MVTVLIRRTVDLLVCFSALSFATIVCLAFASCSTFKVAPQMQVRASLFEFVLEVGRAASQSESKAPETRGVAFVHPRPSDYVLLKNADGSGRVFIVMRLRDHKATMTMATLTSTTEHSMSLWIIALLIGFPVLSALFWWAFRVGLVWWRRCVGLCERCGYPVQLSGVDACPECGPVLASG